jgi:hypothetical protein
MRKQDIFLGGSRMVGESGGDAGKESEINVD